MTSPLEERVDVSSVHASSQIYDAVNNSQYYAENILARRNVQEILETASDELRKLGPGSVFLLPQDLEARYFLGAVYISHHFELIDVVYFTSDSEKLKTFRIDGKSDLKIEVPIGEFLYLGIDQVSIPFVFRGSSLTSSQSLFISKKDHFKLDFNFKEVLDDSDTLTELDGVFFLSDSINPLKSLGLRNASLLHNTLVGYIPSFSSYSSLELDCSDKAIRNSTTLFISEELPFEAWDSIVDKLIVPIVEPLYEITPFRKRVKVFESNISSLEARKEYTEFYLKLAKTEVSGRLEKLFGLVSFYVESIELSPVWLDPTVKLEAPRLDGFSEASEILSSVLDLYTFKVELLKLKSSISESLFIERKEILDNAVRALSRRTYALADYAAELHLLGNLVVEKRKLDKQIKEELSSLSKLSSWDASVSRVIGQTVANDSAATDTILKTKELSSLAENISARISYLKSLQLSM